MASWGKHQKKHESFIEKKVPRQSSFLQSPCLEPKKSSLLSIFPCSCNAHEVQLDQTYLLQLVGARDLRPPWFMF